MKTIDLLNKVNDIFENHDCYLLGASIETMAESFAKKQDDEILGFLYDKYKDTDVSDVYVLSEKDFKRFLLEMLPVWRKGQESNE